MIALIIKLDGEGSWPDLEGKPLLQPARAIEVALLPGGMASGKASVAIRIDLPDGRTVIAQTSEELFQGAARVFRGRLEFLASLSAKGGAPS